jgi:hypothetical protein
VLNAQLVGVEDAPAFDASVLTPVDGTVHWPEVEAVAIMRFPMDVPNAQSSAVVKPVIVHAMINAEGKISEAEIAATSDEALSQAALDLVKKNNYGPGGPREIYVNVRFLPAGS